MYSPKGQNMQTCTEKEPIFGVVKSSNVYLQSLRSVTSLYKNMHLHGNPGSNYKLIFGVVRQIKTIEVEECHLKQLETQTETCACVI